MFFVCIIIDIEQTEFIDNIAGSIKYAFLDDTLYLIMLWNAFGI